VQLIRAKPIGHQLLRATSEADMTFRKLLALLKVNFTEPGSNSRMREDAAYAIFVRYIREVAGLYIILV